MRYTVYIRLGVDKYIDHFASEQLVTLDEVDSRLPDIIAKRVYIPFGKYDYMGGWRWAVMVDSRKIGEVIVELEQGQSCTT